MSHHTLCLSACFVAAVVFLTLSGCDLPTPPDSLSYPENKSEEAAPEDQVAIEEPTEQETSNEATGNTGRQNNEVRQPQESTAIPRSTRPASDNPPREERAPARPDTSSASSSRPKFDLSAGVALPQTLPNGTGMMFSVDYQLIGGQIGTNDQFALVVKPANAQAFMQPQGRLQNSGTIQIIAPGMKPNIGPFEAFIIDRSNNVLSNKEPLKSY